MAVHRIDGICRHCGKHTQVWEGRILFGQMPSRRVACRRQDHRGRMRGVRPARVQAQEGTRAAILQPPMPAATVP